MDKHVGILVSVKGGKFGGEDYRHMSKAVGILEMQVNQGCSAKRDGGEGYWIPD